MNDEQQEKGFWRVSSHIKQIWTLISIAVAVILFISWLSRIAYNNQLNQKDTIQNAKDIQTGKDVNATKEALQALEQKVDANYKEFQKKSSDEDDAIDEVKDKQIYDEGLRDGTLQKK